MKNLLKFNGRLIVITSFVVMSTTIAGNAQPTKTPDEVYNVIKANEPNFPFPQEHDTVEVGVFNPSNGTFDGLHTVTIYSEERHRNFTTQPTGYSHALKSWLKFSINQRVSGTFSVFINGVEYRSNPGQGVLYADAADLKSVSWTISCGTKKYSDAVRIARQPVIAIGAYRIKYLPLLVCYAPPQNERGTNVCDYTHSITVGSSFTITHSQGTQHIEAKMVGLYGFLDFVTKASALLTSNYSTFSSTDSKPTGNVPQDVKNNPGMATIEAVNKIANDITTLIGYQTNSTTFTTSVDSQEVVSSQFVDAATLKAGNGIESVPGHGDMFVALGNVMAFWIVIDSKLYYTLLNDDQTRPYHLSANSIRQQPDHAFQNVLMIDPFCLSDNPDFSSPRFTRLIDPLSGLSSPITIDSYSPLIRSLTITNSMNQQGQYSNATVETVDSKPGILDYFGIGNDNSNIQISYKNSVTHSNTHTEQTVADVNITSTKDSIWEVQLYYDNVFGTIVVQKVPLQQVTVVSTAVLKDNTERVLPSQWVHIKIGDLNYSVITDKTGHFKIYSKALKSEANSVQLQVGKQITTIVVLKNINKEYKVSVTGIPVTGNPLFLK